MRLIIEHLEIPSGNCTKYFPHVGHLGLSPVLVAGTIKLESQDDEEIINVAQIIVRLRCYEAIGGQAQLSKQFDEKYLPGNLNVLWETVSNIWPPPDSSHTSPTLAGDYRSDWRLIVPRSATDPNHLGSAIGSMTYKDWRSWWQLEAVVRGSTGRDKTITKCYPLHLTNFQNLSSLGTLTHTHGTTNNPRINYSLSCPAQISCGDQLTVSLSLHTNYASEKYSDTPKFKRVIISLERTLVGTESADRQDAGHLPAYTSTKTTLPVTPSSHATSTVVPSLRSTRSLGRLNLKASLRPVLRCDRKPIVSVVEVVEVPITSSEQDKITNPRSGFTWSGRVDMTVPRPKSGHYSIGDTCKSSKFISVTYHLKAKVVIKTKSRDTETITLGACEVELSCVPTLERESAYRNYNNSRRIDLHLRKFPGPSACVTDNDHPSLGLLQSKFATPTTKTL
ncbi:hypothetical protein PCANC_25586 [Puccinia coronata f. sp. avenae]|uniref:Arrestin C-terminal-like domain-containing protein n=1 Tax=Puccinia coronata f. sp. avenae TaxID=200324 RepID=A0A2N5TMB1_9BASI|nr:hypothetical protein PCANC_24212 [Puccinia coronata f. sp. avenae]PLW26635.1 hypothetical protein PCANC_25586 [Puccinia coronata f. sp. avenae]